jgi:hypothetical protein
MSKTNTGIQWFGVPVFIVDEMNNSFNIASNSRENPVPEWHVGKHFFDETQRDFTSARPALEYMLTQFKRGKLEPLNDAARKADEEVKAKAN